MLASLPSRREGKLALAAVAVAIPIFIYRRVAASRKAAAARLKDAVSAALAKAQAQHAVGAVPSFRLYYRCKRTVHAHALWW